MEMQKGKGGAAGGGGGKLLLSTLLDAKDELEERLERCVGIVTSLTNGLSEREANDALNAHICKGTPQHEEICLGLFTLVLTEPTQAQKCYRDLALVSRDGMNIVLNKINQILMEKYLKLQDTCRTQLMWLLRELVKSGVLGADGVCMTFMKQIAGGDVTAKNIWLAENVLEILTEQRRAEGNPSWRSLSEEQMGEEKLWLPMKALLSVRACGAAAQKQHKEGAEGWEGARGATCSSLLGCVRFD